LRPMPDYLALSDALVRAGYQVALIDRAEAQRTLSPRALALARRAGPDLPQAIVAMRRRREYDCFVCDSEGIGIPLAALLRTRGAPNGVFLIAHRMTARTKQALWRSLRLEKQVAGAFCYADTQLECMRELGFALNRLHRMPFHADHRFYAPSGIPKERMVLSVGQEQRDYASLIAAASSLRCPVRVLASSPWSRFQGRGAPSQLPPNVSFLKRVSYLELRDLYARAAVVAVPVEPVDFQAGITSLLEAMAMATPVVATANPGLREVFADGEAGIWVPPRDQAALATAIDYLLRHPREAAEMGRRGRALIERGMTLDHWVARITRAVLQAP
ncbi:MAG TPA: glycosyltransferase family 4 protein, partial [Armatimonadota bacterium]|nr:glycosyltransferase family 4 protein [Armatimonadota bacterium]